MTPDIILQRTGIDVRAVEQGDDAWHKLRLGVITASEIHNVIAKPRSGKKWPDMKMSYFHTLLAEVCTGVAPEVNAKALAWGKQYENDARTLFEFTSGVNVTESPIIYRDESMRTACSPDGLCSDGNGLELKCPFTSRDFMKFRLGGFEAIKSAYMAQVQYSMWVTRKDAWYFHDNIRVGTITFVYSVTKRGWVFPGLSVIRNPLKAQRLAEEINNKRGAVCTKHLLLN